MRFRASRAFIMSLIDVNTVCYAENPIVMSTAPRVHGFWAVAGKSGSSR